MPDEGASSVARTASAVRVKGEQDGKSQRVGELRDCTPEWCDFHGRPGAARQRRGVSDLVDDGQRTVHAIADQYTVVARDD